MLDQHYASIPKSCSLLSFLDNLDMNRFLFEARGDKARLKQAVEIQFTQNCPPVIYYGTEVGMSQMKPISGPHGDLQARRMMAWDDQDADLLETYKRLIATWRSG